LVRRADVVAGDYGGGGGGVGGDDGGEAGAGGAELDDAAGLVLVDVDFWSVGPAGDLVYLGSGVGGVFGEGLLQGGWVEVGCPVVSGGR
jgi:hypothetical protein